MKFKEQKRKKKSCSGVMCQWVHQCILGLGHDRVQHHNWKKNSAYCYQAVGSCCFPFVWSNDRAPTGWLRSAEPADYSLSETSEALFSRSVGWLAVPYGCTITSSDAKKEAGVQGCAEVWPAFAGAAHWKINLTVMSKSTLKYLAAVPT